ncbi:sigma factor [Streptomyces silvensis]|uniref:Uncharacterized protein n=1 Tax=Streptomyces silvensis TaxID=1765722 RepID=A0A0W7X7Q7_9ACTN|nr:sigma factor [Streptomyces silvensis]KUF18827.1 hypothetical protein AT728_07265 [Streptomyces silvensis]
MQRVDIHHDIIRAAQGGDQDAMIAVLDACEPMLHGIIHIVAPTASPDAREDYLQEARATLIQHVRDYRTDATEASLTSYAYRAVRRAVTEAHATSECAVSVPAIYAMMVRTALWQSGRDVEKAWEILTNADDTHRMKRTTFLAVVQALDTAGSLDASAGDEDGTALTLADTLPDPSATFVTASTERADMARWLMTQIPARQSLALRAFYGVGMSRQDDSEVCAVMELKAPALRKLRTRGVTSARNVASVHGIAA